jgi:glycosyltransferase involved in cell wall biosynthesis
VAGLFSFPGKILAALWELIRGNISNPEFLFKNLAIFPQSVYLARWVKQNGITYLFGYWATYPASVAMAVSRMTGVPFGFMGHAHDIYAKTTHLAAKMRAADFISTCTASNREYLAKIEPSALDKIRVLRHGLSLEKYECASKPEGPVFILSVGTLWPHKGHGYFLEAMALLRKAGMDVRGAIVGGGPLLSALSKKRAELGLDGVVEITGPLKHAQVIPYYKKAHVFVLAAQAESHWGIPNVILEALAAGAAVVTTKFGSVEEVIQDERTGLIVPGKSCGALAGALARLCVDETLRQALASSGREIVRAQFDIRTCLAEYLQRFGG